jgi:two-component system cell cycle sensor histidine kinase/response regulator CckA
MNTTLLDWLGLGREAARRGRLRLSDVMAADGEALIRAVTRQAHLAPRVVDVDFIRDDGRALPARVFTGARQSEEARPGEVVGLVIPELGSRDAAAWIEAGPVRFFQSAPFGMATISAEGRITDANAAFLRMFQNDPTEPLGTLAGLLARTSDEAGRTAVQAALATAMERRAIAGPVDISLGPRLELTRRLYISPIPGTQPGREAVILYAIDATEQKALELKFAQSQKMEAVGQLAGGIAHDFNNVLTAIIGFSDLLLQTHRPTDAAYKDIMNIKQNANRAAGLVRQLLAFSRRQQLQPEILQLGEVLTDLSVLLNRLLGEKIELKILSGRDLWYVRADRTQFEQMVINLAVNARDAMPGGGRLTVRTRNIAERESLKLATVGVVAGEYVLIEVEDTGVGMTPEVMGKIFEPFFSTKEVGKGTGLGLSTVYGIVKQTGGYILPESTPGKGTTFRIYLPRRVVENEEELRSAKASKSERARDLTGTGRVLLVEDEDAVRSFAVRALKRQGYEVLEAATGVEALEVLSKHNGAVDIVVSDVVMPEMDGPTLLKELRKTNPKLKIIFVSGYPDDAFKKGLGEGEQFAFLPKPFTLPQLAAKVKEQLAEG